MNERAMPRGSSPRVTPPAAATRAWRLAVTCLVGVLLATACTSSDDEASETFDFRDDWAVPESFDISIDASGFSLPTALAFVPDGGSGPRDPLYFVTELRGTVRVVTNDRSIFEFGSVPKYVPTIEVPAGEGSAGLAGICLAPAQGYVFVTFAAQDESGLLRNHIVRFESEPRTFGLQPGGAKEIGEVLQTEQSALSHQIGGCQVDGDALFVSVGDGGEPSASQTPDRPLGKVLRMTLDGAPYPGNPFEEEAANGTLAEAGAYIFAYGLRNPFGLKVADREVFVADNGPEVDRFLRLQPGRNYLWNGTNESMALGADTVLLQAVGPVQLDRYPDGSAMFPDRFRESFYVAASGLQGGIMRVPFDVGTGLPTGTPKFIVRYQGSGNRIVSGLAFGPDGLYFVPVVPDTNGETHVLRFSNDPASDYPHIIGAGSDPISSRGCRSCHVVQGGGGVVGPPLDFFDGVRITRLRERLESAAFLELLDELDALDEEPFVSTREARQQLREATELDKVRTYIEQKIQEPKFANPNAQMPRLGVGEDEARQIANILMAPGSESSAETLGKRVRDILSFYPEGRDGDMLAGATFGFIVGAGGVAALVAGWWLVRWALRRRAAGAHEQ
jgi:glucose/arabinose dehydrogenase